MARCLYTAWQRLLDTPTLRYDASVGGSRTQPKGRRNLDPKDIGGETKHWLPNIVDTFHEIEAMEEAVGKAIWEERVKCQSPTGVLKINCF
jgi:hypothetical protein